MSQSAVNMQPDQRIVESEKKRFNRERHRLHRLAQRDFKERGRGAVVSHWLDGEYRFCEFRTRAELIEMLALVKLDDPYLLPMVDAYDPATSFAVYIFVVRHTPEEQPNGDNAVCLRQTGVISTQEVYQ